MAATTQNAVRSDVDSILYCTVSEEIILQKSIIAYCNICMLHRWNPII